MDINTVISDILDNPNFDTNTFRDLMIMSQEIEIEQLMKELNS
jgi:hypothetical protein